MKSKELSLHIKNYFIYENSIVKKYFFNPLTHGIFLIIFINILLNNPFSTYTIDDSIEFYKPININEIIFTQKGSMGSVYYDIRNDEDIYIYSNSTLGFSVGKVYDDTNTGKYTLQLLDICTSDVHPLPPLTMHDDGDLLVLGTLPSPMESDFLSIISEYGRNTMKLIILSLVSFLISGIISGIILGYYHHSLNTMIKYFRLGNLFDVIIKIFEATPLLLWILLTVIMLELYAPGLTEENASRWTFIFFGLFSSTALTKLIANKIQDLNSEEFVTALKLQGLPDHKIIFNHIIRYFCLPIICYQASYIIAQSYFLDITLHVIKFGFDYTWGDMIHSFISTGQLTSTDPFHLITMLIIIFSTVYVFYNLADYFEEVASE